MFRVPWVDDRGEVQVNRGFRIEMNSAIGPYKGGLRFHPTVNLGVLKFLAFEQVFKNSLTTLSMGGGKGGSDFDPKGKSDNEVMRFCQSFMNELFRHIGPDTDVPAGDIGVGGREIGFLFGQYKKIANRFCGVLTGKGMAYGGSLIRPEATGYGAVYFAEEMLTTRGDSVHGKVAVRLRFRQRGPIHRREADPVRRQGDHALRLRRHDRRQGRHQRREAGLGHGPEEQPPRPHLRVRRQVQEREVPAGQTPWGVKCDLAFPSATQNEINADDAKTLVDERLHLRFGRGQHAHHARGRRCLPRRQDSLRAGQGGQCRRRGRLRAGNGAERRRHALAARRSGFPLARDHEVDSRKLREYGKNGNFINYVKGANIAGFVKVADAMVAQGVV